MKHDELKTLDITAQHIGDDTWSAGWMDNEVLVTADPDDIQSGYSVRSGWLAGYTAGADEDRNERLNGLTLAAAIELANEMAEDRRLDALAEMDEEEDDDE